jgi:hypothetical protein
MMPVTRRPADRGPLFGGKAQVTFVGKEMREAMRRWQERVHAAKNGQPEGQSTDNSAAD